MLSRQSNSEYLFLKLNFLNRGNSFLKIKIDPSNEITFMLSLYKIWGI